MVFVVAPIVLAARHHRERAPAETNGRSSRERIGEMVSSLSETLRGNRVIKTYGMEDFESQRFRTAKTVTFASACAPCGFRPSIRRLEVLAGVGLAALFAYAAGQIGQAG